ncbi:MAG: ATP-grasp domain-containing protein [Pseudomonadota bacterium]
MHVFVCEFVTGGGFAGAPLPESLCREGDMMLQALVKDLAELPQIELVAARDGRLPDPGLPCTLVRIGESEDPWAAWRRIMADADAVWPIAPETDGLLERLSTLVCERGRRLLGSPPAAIRLAASKRKTAAQLAAHGIAAVPTLPLLSALADGLPPSNVGWVVKPDDGAGSEDTLLFYNAADIGSWAASRRDIARFAIQPYLPGAAASLSLLCCDGQVALLSCNSQDVCIEGGRFHYRGGVVGGAEDRRAVYEPLAARIATALPDLWGHAGIDLVEASDGPVVLEINPRLTTSYVGLRRALGANPAAPVLRLLEADLSAIAIPQPVRPQLVRTDAAAP